MRTENANKERLLSREAASDITKNRFCTDSGANKVTQIAVQGTKPACISRYGAAAGHAVSCQYPPSDTIVESGGVVGDNVEVVADAQGRAIDQAGGAVGDWIAGRTINGSSSTAAGQKLTIRFNGEGMRQK